MRLLPAPPCLRGPDPSGTEGSLRAWLDACSHAPLRSCWGPWPPGCGCTTAGPSARSCARSPASCRHRCRPRGGASSAPCRRASRDGRSTSSRSSTTCSAPRARRGSAWIQRRQFDLAECSLSRRRTAGEPPAALGRRGESQPPSCVAPLSGASPSAHPVGIGKGDKDVASDCRCRAPCAVRSGARCARTAVRGRERDGGHRRRRGSAPAPADEQPAAKSAPASSVVVVKRGDRGDGRPPGPVGARASPPTECSAPRPSARSSASRSRKGLAVDGVVGPQTRDALGLEPFARSAVKRESTGAKLPRILRRIAECESGGNPRAVSPGGQLPRQVPVQPRHLAATWAATATRRCLGGRAGPPRAEAVPALRHALPGRAAR